MDMARLLIHARPGRAASMILSWVLFVVGIGAYVYIAQERHRENADERVTPTLTQIMRGMTDAVLQPAEEDEPAAPDATLRQRLFGCRLWRDT